MTHLNQPKRNATGTAAAAATLSQKKRQETRKTALGSCNTSNGAAADDLIVKYINQDIETFHLARNCQVLSGPESWAGVWGEPDRGEERAREMELTAVQVSSKVDIVTVGTAKQAAYWRC